VTDPILDRAVGAFLGLAIGDAVGTTVEFLPRDAFTPMTDMVGGGPFRLEAGKWTDDTSMALCLAESLLHDPNLDPYDLMQRFRRWVEFGENSSTGQCFDIGKTTLSAIGRFRRDGNPVAGSTLPRDAGNGSIMRLAPVALRWWHEPLIAERVARRQSEVTHGAAEAVDGCVLLSRILCAAIGGQGRQVLVEPIDIALAPAIRAVADGSWRPKNAHEIASTGYVVHTLEAALWAVGGSNGFEDAILRAVNLGHDADTTGAVAGQIAGAIYGSTGIPARWRHRLYDAQRIADISQRLYEASL
jgi:ADP-ribosyl-[dinitrogen reductase] hydrolase